MKKGFSIKLCQKGYYKNTQRNDIFSEMIV